MQLIQPIKAQLQLQSKQFTNMLEGISDEQSNLQAKANLNPVKWIAGHLVHSRYVMISVLTGETPHPVYAKYFAKGTSNKIDIPFPVIEEIKEQWNAVSEQLIVELEKVSDVFLKSKPPFQTFIPDETILGLIAYLAVHEAQHFGQISILKKILN